MMTDSEAYRFMSIIASSHGGRGDYETLYRLYPKLQTKNTIKEYEKKFPNTPLNRQTVKHKDKYYVNGIEVIR